MAPFVLTARIDAPQSRSATTPGDQAHRLRLWLQQLIDARDRIVIDDGNQGSGNNTCTFGTDVTGRVDEGTIRR